MSMRIRGKGFKMKNATLGDCGLTPTVQAAIDWARQEAGYPMPAMEILGQSRRAHVVKLRRLAMWRLRTEYLWSFPRIALAFDGRDHSTVMHHVKLENLKRGYAEHYPLQGHGAQLSKARHKAHVQRMAIKYAGGASYAGC